MNLTSKVADLFCESKARRQFHAALETKYERLYRLAYAWCHHSALAQDLVQDTLLKALEKRKQLDNLEHLDAWLTKIMHNQFLDCMRFNRRWEWADADEIDQHHCMECSESQMIKEQVHQAFYQAMGQLTLEQRQAISLADLQGFSYQEISDVTATPVGTVMSRISRGREKLRQLIQANEMYHSESGGVAPP
jgi:RNA polymerase sigma-70 factor (ECF subfamily)